VEKIREIIRKEIQSLFEDFQYRYDGNFYPNQSMIKNCLDALNAVEKNDLIKTIPNNNEGSGKIKAKKIVEKQPITHSQLKRMKAFFDNNESEVSKEKAKGETIHTSGLIQSWNLWGGDEGKSWCNNHISQRKSSNKTSKTVRGASGLSSKNLMNPFNTRIHR
tara:strand:- start:2523 stop:3011 length:489 start_codon:yes stop_codon:yes gene_type:complete